MEAGKYSLDRIITGENTLEVPFYQRSYVWNHDQWARLLEDMDFLTNYDRTYFIGSIIIKQKISPMGRMDTIIDGQQRLTTLSIFFKVLCLKTNATRRFDRRFRLDNGNIAIKHSYRDKEAFDHALNMEAAETIDKTDRISKCFNYFVENLDETKLDFDKIFNNLLFVVISLGPDEDEQQIFDTINSLGVRLTTAELLKNYFFRDDDINSYKEYWENVFELDKETIGYWEQEIMSGRFRRTLIDTFFYAFLQIKIQDKSLKIDTKEKLLFSKVDRLFDSYKHLVGNDKYNIDKKELLEEIREYAGVFRSTFDPKSVNYELESENSINRVNNLIFGLDSAILITYVLYLVKKNKDNQKSLNDMLAILESYMVRRVIVRASTREYGGLFNESLILNNVFTKKEFLEYVNKRSDNVFMPDDIQLKQGFETSKLTNNYTRGILYLLESSIRDHARHSIPLKSLKSYSLEHIMPKKWQQYWSEDTDLDNEEAVRGRNDKLLTLGNLTLLTDKLNSNISNANWETKLNGRGSHRGLKTYASGIETLTTYLEIPQWDEKSIEHRANDLYKSSVRVWSDS